MNVFRGRVGRLIMVAMLCAMSISLMGLRNRPGPRITPTNQPAPSVPEPAGFVVFAIGAGVVGLALHRRSRRN